jgi:pre-rRNA-processing protein TSR4
MQVTPQLLSYLQLDNTNQDALDWGTLLVYTCSSHCDGANGSYAEEVVICQQFSSQGLGDSIRKKLQERESLLEEKED